MQPLLFASIAIVLIAVSAPQMLGRHVDRPQRGGAVAAVAPEQPPTEAARAGREAEFQVESDGHFYVEAEVNFSRVRLMVDTGASVVALRRSDAAAAGIRPSPAEFVQPVATANGQTFAAEAHLDSVMVADIEVNGVRALVLPDEQLAVSLLGGSFLSRLARYEVEDGTLIFAN